MHKLGQWKLSIERKIKVLSKFLNWAVLATKRRFRVREFQATSPGVRECTLTEFYPNKRHHVIWHGCRMRTMLSTAVGDVHNGCLKTGWGSGVVDSMHYYAQFVLNVPLNWCQCSCIRHGVTWSWKPSENISRAACCILSSLQRRQSCLPQ